LNDANNSHYIPPPSGSGLKIPILFGIVIALAAANVYLFLQIDQMRSEVAAMQNSLLNEVSDLRETSSVTNQTQQRRLETMREELEAARRQAAVAAGQAKEQATKRAEQLAKDLEAEQQRQRAATQQVKQDLTQVARATETNEATIKQVDTSVQETKSELDKTISALTAVTGDLGVQSGLIATNAQELSALKALGERNYYEFDIRKSKQPVRVGDIALKLKKTNRKRGRFTLEVVADDRAIEKKDRTLNEPLQFYVSGARQPYEIVVNEVEKNRIVGYLATPKVKSPRGETQTASASE
jgi:chromosome segregation ATPase